MKLATAGSFESLDPSLHPLLLQSLNESNYTQMTPVQAATIPLFLKHKDVVAEAATGSGKTLAFVLPTLHKILSLESLKSNQLMAIMVVPTRELASQVFDVVKNFKLDIQCHLFVGGTTVQEDIQRIKQGVHIAVGTPGRLEDLLKREGVFYLKDFEILVLDEADRLLNMGFKACLTSIISKLPKQRRTCLFSATMNDALDELIRAGLRNPVKVTVKIQNTENESQRVPTSLHAYYKLMSLDEKLTELINLLLAHPNKKWIIFFATCACVDYFYRILSKHPLLMPMFNFFGLHGKLPANKRDVVFQNFSKAKDGSVLIATDIAARGLDFPDIDWVVQVDAPQDPESFAHRCGRTARMGKEGYSAVFLTPSEDVYIEFLKLRGVPLSEMPSFDSKMTKQQVYEYLIEQNKSDRDLYEKSTKAFVSWIRSYKEHQAHYIFQFKNVDLGALGHAFGLLKIPSMPELKTQTMNYTPPSIDLNHLAYKDKQREKQRLIKLNAPAPPPVEKKIKSSAPWSKKKEMKEKRLERREKKAKRKTAILEAKKAGNFKKRSAEEVKEEWDELQKEARKIKKGKRGKQAESSSDSSDFSDE